MRVVLLSLAALSVWTGTAAAAPADDQKAVALLEKIVAGPDAATRTAAIKELDAVAPHAVEAIGTWIVRSHTSDVDTRRGVLRSIEAEVPDKSGKFAVVRQTGSERKANDEVDWLTALQALPPSTPGVGEVIADDAAIRALAATSDITAASRIMDVAFNDATMIYRDECGRYLRKMEPYSIPSLIKESAGTGDRKRYGNFQLERIDRQDPIKALDAAIGDEALQIAIIDVYRTTKLREAVHAVWTRVNADAPRVREAARATWMEYITGPEPKPAPKEFLKLPGGKLTKKAKPLWLTYRELADNELRRSANELLHESYSLEDPNTITDSSGPDIEPIDQVDVTKRLFAYYDGERAKRDGALWSEAQAKAVAGDLAGATALVDRLVATTPDRPEKVDMAKLYAQWAKQLESKQQWSDAAAAYSKAHGLDPTAATANANLAAHHYALGMALKAKGKDGGPDFRRAIALNPSYAPAQEAAEQAEEEAGRGRPTWMLYAAVGAATVALLLCAAALAMRRRRTA